MGTKNRLRRRENLTFNMKKNSTINNSQPSISLSFVCIPNALFYKNWFFSPPSSPFYHYYSSYMWTSLKLYVNKFLYVVSFYTYVEPFTLPKIHTARERKRMEIFQYESKIDKWYTAIISFLCYVTLLLYDDYVVTCLLFCLKEF